ncbi:Vacuolar sorting protein 9 (VPS9) domain [Seminavis robusta]|uniref:Vacuolar sorting protein 9 (VPS9) domain n=1 Tax=Seminavis robusta TaxID=568900 RepID=A0A9N8ELT3_9STRA|nr:Vacuolar sorting protein 9 (VPS9) domain [Seminavis robusta]|eukprot:Sro1421_g271180.1 Vacuolar sorting protein 9 (VPS9) domain (710) ;mRNA; f:7378-9821
MLSSLSWDPNHQNPFYTIVLVRHPHHGLGLSLMESRGWVRVVEVSDKIADVASKGNVGDILIGVNGLTISEISPQKVQQLRQVVNFLRSCPSPVVLHLQQGHPDNTALVTKRGSNEPKQSSPVKQRQMRAQMHPLEKAIASRGFLRSSSVPALETTRALAQFSERARQWQLSNSFLVDVTTLKLQSSLQSTAFETQLPTLRNLVGNPHRNTDIPSYRHYPTPKTTTSSIGSLSRDSTLESDYFNLPNAGPYIVIPLVGVRKALSPRILNSFLDGELVAFTMWVRDAESGREWYAPLRYFQDFQDLREATSNIYPLVDDIPFPSQAWSLFGPSDAPDSDAAREAKRAQLESYLRRLCGMIYRDALHPAIIEVAIHLQSFLGCDSALKGADQWPCIQSSNGFKNSSWDGVKHSELQVCTRESLKRSFELYTYRVLLLDSVQQVVANFVSSARDNSPTLLDIEYMNSDNLKRFSTDLLKRIKAAVDQLQGLILEGCFDDFKAIANGELYRCLHPLMLGGGQGQAYLDRLLREAVREQVEIAVYLPLRSTTSRLLVNAWRHEDAEVAFKLRDLRSRPQGSFHFERERGGLSSSVSGLLKKVSSSALPCAKLRALFDAAMEISRVYQPDESSLESGDLEHFGADDFLPALVHSVIRSDIERPFAVCALLRTLCDQANQIGEVGYYLASFEAAITHIREMDLSESDEFLTSIPSW